MANDHHSPLEERLARGKENRAAIISRHGFVPTSVLRLSRGSLSRSVYNFAKEIGKAIPSTDSVAWNLDRKSDGAKRSAKLRRELGLLGVPAGGKNKSMLSIMPAELVEFCLRYYCPDGGTYIDPFAGQGVRAQVSALLGYEYTGTDLTEEFVVYTERVLERLAAASPEQLGTGKTYPEFLDGMAEVYLSLRKTLKPDAWVVINVNDIRRDGVAIPYHADLIRLLPEIGYTYADLWILDGLVGGIPRAYAVKYYSRKLVPRVHEYLLVFRP